MFYKGIIKEPPNHPHLNICIYESKNLDSNELQEMYNNFIGFFVFFKIKSILVTIEKSGVVVTLYLFLGRGLISNLNSVGNVEDVGA